MQSSTPLATLGEDSSPSPKSSPQSGCLNGLISVNLNSLWYNGLFRERSAENLDEWLRDAFSCGVFTMRRFAKTLRQDKSAVQNAVTEPWSNGQTEGQINRLKTLKRSMYGRASTELLRARMLPLQDCNLHRE